MSAMEERRTLRIGQLAARVGVTARTIRYYEERGLLGPGERTRGAHRLYGEADVTRLRELLRMRDLLGLSLEELVELAEAEEARAALRDRWAGSASDAERRRIVDTAVPLVERQLELVRKRRATLDAFAAELEEKLRSLETHQHRLGAGSVGQRPKPGSAPSR